MVPANLPEVLSRLGYDPVNLFDKSGAGRTSCMITSLLPATAVRPKTVWNR
jgi:hypothetical protein